MIRRSLITALLLTTQTLAHAATTQPAQPISTDVTTLGILPDGTTLNTAALQKAIDITSAHGGGTLTFPAGRYLIGTLQLKDNVTLHLDQNAVLLGSTNAADYRNLDPFLAGDGVPLGYALIVALDAHHVAIEGPGAIDGQGKTLAASQKPYAVRPFLIRWIRCDGVSLSGVTLQNPGAWTNHFFQSRNVAVNHVTIRSYATGLKNNDGIDIDSCQSVHITDADIESGDDAICLKTTSPNPCTDIAVTHSKLKTRCNAIKLGTESLGDFERINISHCDLRDIGMAGIALYTVDGGNLHDVTVADITMDTVAVPISIRLGARLKTFRSGDRPKPPGTLRDITVRNVHVTHAARIGVVINGIPNHPVQNLTLDNIQIQLPGNGKNQDAALQLPEKEAAYPEMSMFGRTFPAYAMYLRHIDGITLHNIAITTEKTDPRPANALIDVQNATPATQPSTK